ncbi:glutathione S-transferase N-terminal domain-containing protein [uncultured Tateyamaria sp.]|uniref:glutathione S-transferase N-terminal domain-containing protein n=1 Tax=uncultured Tateyamaria sp. TaxID=455651 RepID=UPI0026351C78|nr:glutathione S-transferase N-terminal domain-containing protein [uncultured Tateyamaria sp.]
MTTLYAWNTPNGQKPAVMLEELGVPYDLVPINIERGEQTDPAFLKVNPNAKIPALTDASVSLFESGAILMHLAEKHGRFLPEGGQSRADTLAWSFWQVGGLGPMIGQWGHFLMLDEKLPTAIERYLAETLRLFTVLEGRLAASAHLGGADYTIADMMVFPWARGGLIYLDRAAADRLPDLPHTCAWVAQIEARPAVKRAFAKLDAIADPHAA